MAVRFHCPRKECRGDLCPAKNIYSCLSPVQDALLGRERLARSYEAGQVVIHHETPALGVLSIHSGQLKLTRSAHNGNEVVVGTRGPGELLGVREVLSAMPYQVSAKTLEPSVVCAVPREAFLGAVRECPELAMRLLGQMAKDYLLTEEQLAARTHASVAARTARLLVTLTNGRGADPGACHAQPVSMSREEMALLIGTTRETLSRTLRQLAEKGAVDVVNGDLRVLDHSLLERLCD